MNIYVYIYPFDIGNQSLIFSANFYFISGNISSYHLEYNLQIKFLFTFRNYVAGHLLHFSNYVNWNKAVGERHTVWFHSYVESNEQTELTRKTEKTHG